MKCLCFSDSHGVSSYIDKAISLHRDAEVVFFLGDGLSDIEPLTLKYKNVAFLAVRGNCDFSSMFLGCTLEKTGAITLVGKRIVYTHGDLYGAKYGDDGLLNLAKARFADVVLFGHTHVPKEKYVPTEEGGIYLFNPGSIGFSYGNAPSYGIIELRESGVSFSHGSFL